MIYRDILDAIRPWLQTDKIIIIKGARQVGKTTILTYLKNELEASGRQVRYIAADLDFADPSFGDPRLFILRLDDLFGGKPGTILIDEFQTIPQSGLFLKTVHDQTKDRYRFLVSGSSTLELTRNAEFLTGRKKEFTVGPFSFREFVRARYPGVPLRSLDPSDNAALADFASLYGSTLKTAYSEYLSLGGYPEPVLSPPELRLEILKELLSTYIRKDVAGYLRIDNVSGFNNLVRLLGSQIGSQVNKSELASTLRLNSETVYRYLDILEGTFMYRLVPPWFTNPRKETSKMPKVYVTDFGILIASGAGMVANVPYDLLDGHRVENAVWSSLGKTFGTERIKYWRTSSGAEVDFIIETDSGLAPVEVKFSTASPSEPVAMRNFRAQYKEARPGLIVSRDTIGDSPAQGSGRPMIVPAYLVDFLDFGLWKRE
ncbi:MAG: ATP-binding protein [Rectinemataceae bacterium]